MSKSKILEALALVGLYPGHEFNIAGSDTVYYIDKDYGILTKNDDIARNEKLVTILSNPDLIIKCCEISEKEQKSLSALYTLGFRYIARDRDASLCAYDSLPTKRAGAWLPGKNCISITTIPHFNPKIDFQFIKWEDEKPFDIKVFLEGAGYEI